MVRTQIYLPEKQLRVLKTIAVEENISLSETIRRLVEERLMNKLAKTQKSKDVGGWLLSLAAKAKKLKIKGPKDLASNIDKYLYGDGK